MLYGQKLGLALTQAMKKKKTRGVELARLFEVSPSSIQEWKSRGTIRKDRIPELVRYFADVVPPSHWGLDVADFEGDGITIRQYDTGGAMGSGLILRDQPGEIYRWTVSPEWAAKNLPSTTSIKNLAMVTGFGDSMDGLFKSGDPLIVDTGVRQVIGDAVYFFRVGEEGFIKRLQRIPGRGVGIVVLSENPVYRDWEIQPDMDFEIFGRVLKVWHGHGL